MHPECGRATIPESNRDFWAFKLERNRRRDLENVEVLGKLGWETLTVWECELLDLDAAVARIVSFLGPAGLRQVDYTGSLQQHTLRNQGGLPEISEVDPEFRLFRTLGEEN